MDSESIDLCENFCLTSITADPEMAVSTYCCQRLIFCILFKAKSPVEDPRVSSKEDIPKKGFNLANLYVNGTEPMEGIHKEEELKLHEGHNLKEAGNHITPSLLLLLLILFIF